MDSYDVLTKLVGEIDPIGETTTDNIRYENLKEMCLVVARVISDLRQVSVNADRVEYSMKRAGGFSRDFLLDLKDELSNYD